MQLEVPRLFRTDDADAEVDPDFEGDDHGLEIDPAFSQKEVIQEGGCLDTLGDLQEVSAVALQFGWLLLRNRITVLMKCIADISAGTIIVR